MLKNDEINIDISKEIEKFGSFVSDSGNGSIIFLDGKFGEGKTYFIKEYINKYKNHSNIYINTYSSSLSKDYITFFYNDFKEKRSNFLRVKDFILRNIVNFTVFVFIIYILISNEFNADILDYIKLGAVILPIPLIGIILGYLATTAKNEVSYHKKYEYVKSEFYKNNDMVVVLDDFDRLLNYCDYSESLKVLDFLNDTGVTIIVIGSINNIMNENSEMYLEKYLDYTYPFPYAEITKQAKIKLEEIVLERIDDDYNRRIFNEVIKRYLFKRWLNFREIIKLMKLVRRCPEKINFSEYYVSSFYYVTNYKFYNYLYYVLNSFLFQKKQYNKDVEEYNIAGDEAKKIDEFFLELIDFGSSLDSYKAIYPDSYAPKYSKMMDNPKLYFINAIDNEQLDFNELCVIVRDLIDNKKPLSDYTSDIQRFKLDFINEFRKDIKHIVDYHIQLYMMDIAEKPFSDYIIPIYVLTDWDNNEKYIENFSEIIPNMLNYGLEKNEEYALFRYQKHRSFSLSTGTSATKNKYSEIFKEKYLDNSFAIGQSYYLSYLSDYAKEVGEENAIELFDEISTDDLKKYVSGYKVKRGEEWIINITLFRYEGCDIYQNHVQNKVIEIAKELNYPVYDCSSGNFIDERIA